MSHGLKIATLEDEVWWGRLDHTEKVWVRKSAQALGEALVRLGHSRLAVGEQLCVIHGVLAPKRLFYTFIMNNFRQSRTTAHRYMEEFRAAQKSASPVVLEIAMAHGFHPAVDAWKGVPDTEDQAEIVRYLSNASNVRQMPAQQVVIVEHDRKVIAREVANFAASRLKRLPAGIRPTVARTICGMILGEVGCTVMQKITPAASPQGSGGSVKHRSA